MFGGLQTTASGLDGWNLKVSANSRPTSYDPAARAIADATLTRYLDEFAFGLVAGSGRTQGDHLGTLHAQSAFGYVQAAHSLQRGSPLVVVREICANPAAASGS